MAAGDIIYASRTLAERTTTGSTFTTSETQLDSITAPLKNGVRYRVAWEVTLSSSAAGDNVSLRIREDTAVGNNLRSKTVPLPTASTGYAFLVETEYVAVSTGNKTFVFSGQRSAGGTGTITPSASSTTNRVRMIVEAVLG